MDQKNAQSISQKASSSWYSQADMHIMRKLDIVARNRCNINCIEDKWIDKITSMAFFAASETKLEGDAGLYSNCVDIIDCVKIKLVLSEDETLTRVFKGYCATKNVLNKRMQTELQNPRVLLFTTSIEFTAIESQLIKFEEIINFELGFLRKTIEKIMKFKPDIIFVENTININALKDLKSKGVTVISKLKRKHIEQVKQVTKIKKCIDRLYNFSKLSESEVVGQCSNIYFKKFQYEDNEKTVMFLQDPDSPIASIVLADTDGIRLSCLQKIVRNLLRIARQLCLERHLIYTDMFHLSKIPEKYIGYMTSFLDNIEENVENYLIKKKFLVSKVCFVKTRFSEMGDLAKQHLFSISTYFKKIRYKFPWCNRDEMELCRPPQSRICKFYSKDSSIDMPLGQFIRSTITNTYEHCEREGCKHLRINHTTLYYYPNCVIKIITRDNNCNSLNNTEGGEDKFDQKYITTHFQCEECLVMQCQPFRLTNDYLRNSLLLFLQKLSASVKDGYPNAPETDGKKCTHRNRIRVFSIDNYQLRFTVIPQFAYKVDEIQLKSQRSLDYFDKLEKQFLAKIIPNEFTPLQKASETLIQFLRTIAGSIPADYENKRIGSKIITAVECLHRLIEILDRMILDMEEAVKKNHNLLQVGYDYTKVVKESHDFYTLFEIIYKITVELDMRVKKGSSKRVQESNLNTTTASSAPTHEQEHHASSPEKSIMEAVQVTSTVSVLPEIITKHDDLTNLVYNKIPERMRDIRNGNIESAVLNYAPLYKDDPVSCIGFALNSVAFSALKDSDQKQIKVKISMTCPTLPESKFKKSVEEIKETLKLDLRSDERSQYNITVYHHSSFQKIRTAEGISFQTFVQAVLGCANWDSSGGKSGSRFAKSYNDMIVMKFINDKEFEEFKKFVAAYISYIEGMKAFRSDTLLAKIYGIFDVTIRGIKYNCIVMQNIFYRLNINDVIVYDLKGSETNRFAIPKEGKLFTGLDNNFKVDRNGEPVALTCDNYDRVIETLEKDASFLSEQEVIDYSLLLIMNQEQQYIRMGIIDFMRPYHALEKLETFYKEMRSGGEMPTVIPPIKYRDRFIGALRQYFVKVQPYD